MSEGIWASTEAAGVGCGGRDVGLLLPNGQGLAVP